MADPAPTSTPNSAVVGSVLEAGTYEILRARLFSHRDELKTRLEKLNAARQEVFGSVPTALIATERLTTKNNCLARDVIPLRDRQLLFGYNVHFGLRTETHLDDVFALYEYRDGQFHPLPIETLGEPQFEADFKDLYRYYKEAVFTKFSIIEPHLFMEFRIGKTVNDIKTFKWLRSDGRLKYLGNRFDHECRFPAQHEFEWKRTHRELHRGGLHPHISIEDRVFVECVGGDLTIKVEDNTDTGEGIYSEPVDHRDQTLDDAEIYYATVGNLIILKVRPYQEKAFRYLVFNEKVKEVRRIDAIADACVLLPDGQGIIFSRGYYLQSGEYKLFETELSEMLFYKRIASPNGEDFLYIFYNRESGDYILLSYNRISRSVETPIFCGGFSRFENGEMALIRNSPEPQKHHVVQIWQTPYVGESWQPEVHLTSYLYKLGNPPLVECMAECQGVLALAGKEDSFEGLYLDLSKKATDILDTYFWLDRPETFDLRTPLNGIREAAQAALAEFDKVSAIKRSSAEESKRVLGRARQILARVAGEQYERIEQFVTQLAQLQAVRGELISLKELRYVELAAVEEMEEEVVKATDGLAQRTVEFLLKPEALEPFRERVEELKAAGPAMPKVSQAQKLEDELNQAAGDLDLLVETVSNLKISDATETTRIIESISAIYATLNQGRAALKQRIRDLRGTEATAEFASQSRLIDQALANYLDLCTAPEKCEEFLTRIMVQVEELEARFADFEEFVVQLAEKRTVLAGAFEQRKLELLEGRNRRAAGIVTAAERILKAIKHRGESVKSLDELNAYFASDAMVTKVREQVEQLVALGDTVKADDLASRLKTLREDAVRQLKDKQDLFAGGPNVIQLGRHQFLTNTQELDFTVVPQGSGMALHITGTNFFEPIDDPAFLETKPAWDLAVSSETPEIYRGEYLAFKMLGQIEADGRLAEAAAWTDEEWKTVVRDYMGPRYGEGYVKGVHDEDAAKIVAVLIQLHNSLGLLRYPSRARALAALFWEQLPQGESKERLNAKLRGFGTMIRLFPTNRRQLDYLGEVRERMADFVRSTGVFTGVKPEGAGANGNPGHAVDEQLVSDAAEYLYFQLKLDQPFAVSREAGELATAFEQHITAHRFMDAFQAARQALAADLVSCFELVREWVRGYVSLHAEERGEWIDEAAWLVTAQRRAPAMGATVAVERTISGIAGAHARIRDGQLHLHYHEFMARLRSHELKLVPLYERCTAMKKRIVEDARKRLRLDDFKPKILTSFVRNRLIDTTYLPLVADNLAKQIGAAGEAKRTDRMGMLLLISPPGYGKTTLVEYLANRLGIVFVKVNGPAIGHRVTSLDPAEAPNAAAREELEKLNLAFEMGDNVMVCLDDIQHLSPEFLQKFISLCDGSRRIEGVYRGKPKTFDLRGKKVVVVMAGNPYTESGEKFKIPDMLANRADTYNLGDVVGAHAEAFRDSYVENAAGSNPTLARMATRNPEDILTLVELAQRGPREGLEFEGNYSPEEQSEFLSVMRKLLRIRDVVLRVNEEYIRSAAQADAYRTEPAFKLQGSYRNMNRLAEKVSPVMNDAELEGVIASHYRNEAQTLTSGAEANLLKFQEITGTLGDAGRARWEGIKTTFRRGQMTRGSDGDDPVSRVVAQLSACYQAIDSVKGALVASLQKPLSVPAPPAPNVAVFVAPMGSPAPPAPAPTSSGPGEQDPAMLPAGIREVAITEGTLRKIWELIEAERRALSGEPKDGDGEAEAEKPQQP